MTSAHLPVVDRAPGHRRALAVVMATVLVPLVVGSAAAKTTPVVTVTPTVTGATVSVQIDVDQKSNQVASCSYVLDANPAVSCGTIAANGKQASRYTIGLTNQATGGHTISVTVVLNNKGTGSGSATFTIAAPRLFAVAFTDTNGDHAYQAGTDDLIAALVDSNRDGTPDAGDTVVANEFPLTVDPVSAWGQFGVKSDAVTNVSIVPGNVSAQSATGSYSWDVALDIEVFDSVSILGGFVSRIEDNGNPGFGNTDSVSIFPDSPLGPSPDTVSSSVHDTTDNEFIDIATDLP